MVLKRGEPECAGRAEGLRWVPWEEGFQLEEEVGMPAERRGLIQQTRVTRTLPILHFSQMRPKGLERG